MRRYALALVGTVLLLGACMPGGMGSGMMGSGHMGGMMGQGMMSGPTSPPPAVTPAPTATPGGAATVSYSRDVQPIFTRSCIVCHGGQHGLWLDSYEHALVGGEMGPVIVPGDPQASELYRRITGVSQPAMPLGQPSLSPNDIAVIERWVAEGAAKN